MRGNAVSMDQNTKPSMVHENNGYNKAHGNVMAGITCSQLRKLAKIDIGGKGDHLKGLDASSGTLTASKGLKVAEGTAAFLLANVHNAELKVLEIDHAHGIKREIGKDQRPFEKRIVRVG